MKLPFSLQGNPAPHPRLYVRRERFERLASITAEDPWFHPPAEATTALAEKSLDPATLPEFSGHNRHLLRARETQTRVVSLIVEFFRTGDERYRRAALAHIAMIRDWEYWSWITWKAGNADPLAIFDLSYGENSATLAIAWDWLHDRLSPEERAVFLQAIERPVRSFLKHTPWEGPRSWWYGLARSNWNAVCAGGIGMLALAFAEELPEAEEILRRVEDSITPFMEGLRATQGGWAEGVGYWNFGMRYAFMYLLSVETATGIRHPFIELPETRRSLYFPFDFCPNRQPCGFGDANGWAPLAIHGAMAQRLGCDDLVGLHRAAFRAGAIASWPNDAEALLLVSAGAGAPPPPERNAARLYEGLDWGVLADRMPNPTLYAAIRGGKMDHGHGHIDLTSYHLVVGDERAIFNVGLNEYLDSTFSPRRFEVYETTAQSKNVVLVNGLGAIREAEVRTRRVDSGPGCPGYVIESNTAIPGVNTQHRLFLLLEGRAVLVLDRVQLPHEGRFESRLHTEMDPHLTGSTVLLQGMRQRCSLTLASDRPCGLHLAGALITSPREPVQVLRWITRGLHESVIFAALHVPGEEAGEVEVASAGEGVRARVRVAGREYRLSLTSELTPATP